ncbi:MAG: IS66 family transposase [Rikenellaceae bacterium]
MKNKGLEGENQRLKEEVLRLQNERNNLLEQYAHLEQEFQKLRHMLFGRKSERYIKEDPSQLKLDIEQGDNVEQVVAKVEKSEPKLKRVNSTPKEKIHPVRRPIPESFERATPEIVEPEVIPQGSKRIGEEITEVMEFKPAEVYVRVICRPKYATPDGGIIIAELPEMAFPKSNAGASLISAVLTQKYVDHLPLNRQGEIFKRGGYEVASSTMTNWVQHGVERLRPLYNYIVEQIRSSEYVQVDETTLPVLKADRAGAAVQGYLWAVNAPLLDLTAFHWDAGSRSRRVLTGFLSEYQGALQSDGYGAYNIYENTKGVTLLGCWAHARRKFFEARDEYPEFADKALEMIGELYAVEREADEKGLSPEQRVKLREQRAFPVIRKLQDWMIEIIGEILPKSRLGKAIVYTSGIYPRLARYITNGRYRIDNNGVENAIRPIALGRKNYLYCGNDASAERTAIIYTIVACCKKCGVNPFEYMTKVLPMVESARPSEYHTLMPRELMGVGSREENSK